MQKRNLITTIYVMAAFDVVEIIIGCLYSADARAWWLMSMFFAAGTSVLYALIFASIIGNRRVGTFYVVFFNLAYRLVHLGFAILFYTHQVDWYAVNNRLASLSFWERILYDHWTSCWLPVIALCVHVALILLVYTKNKDTS